MAAASRNRGGVLKADRPAAGRSGRNRRRRRSAAGTGGGGAIKVCRTHSIVAAVQESGGRYGFEIVDGLHGLMAPQWPLS